jgi:hypothetical protein
LITPRLKIGLSWGLVALAAAVLVYRALLVERETVDDLFIYLRYARNLAKRHEVAFSPGVRVEGFSSPLWTLLLSVFWSLGVQGVAAAKGLGLLVLAAIPFAAALAVRRSMPKVPLAAALPACALALDSDLALWGISGMDTPLFALACVGCVAMAAGSSTERVAFALGILPWVRPEGPLLTVLGAGVLLLHSREVRVLRVLTYAFAPLVVLTALRVGYFHEVLPNTFFAKMGATDGRDFTGLGYVGSALARRPVLFLLALLVPLVRRPVRRETALALALLAGVVVFALAAGGDWMPNRRLLVPALPLAALAVTFAGWPQLSYVLVVLALEGAWSTDRALDQRWRHLEPLDRRVSHGLPPAGLFRTPYPLDWMPTHLLDALAPYVHPGDTVAHVDMGQLPYVMHDVGFLDGFGLVDREAGRVQFAPDDRAARARASSVFFAVRPVAVIVVLDRRSGEAFSPSQRAVLGDPRFNDDYREIWRVPTWGNHPCVVLVRRDRPPADDWAARRTHWLAAVRDVSPSD